MTKQIYKYPYNAKTEDEIKIFLSDQICEQVMKITYKNGQIFCTIKDRITSKNKEILLSAAIFFGALLVMPTESPAIGVPIRFPSAPEIHRPVPQYFPKYAPTINPRVEKIIMITNNKMIPLIYINGHYSYINEQLLRKLRAGDLSASIIVVTIGVIVYVMCQLSGIDAFTILRELGRLNAPTVDPRFGLNPTTPSRPGSGSTLQITRPTAMPHQEFDGLTKEDRRQVPHHHDKIIDVEGHPRLRVGFWQSRYKVPDHGSLHGLLYSVKNNGGTKTEKSDDTALAMMQSIEDMPHRPNAIWFDQDEAIYQGGTDRAFPAVYIFDDDTKVVAVFNKQTGNFVTTCQLTEKQETELKGTHNFGGGEGWFSGKVNNLPPKGITSINSFENDVMGITPVDDSQIDNSNN
jgi:hypothetical protein